MNRLKDISRESWLLEATKIIDDEIFAPMGETLPDVRVSIGLPSVRAMSTKNRRIGECWAASTSDDEVPSIFISPIIDDHMEALEILVHELIHAKGINGHRKDFRTVALKVGLDGPMTATHAGPELRERLDNIAERLGEFPHAKLNASNRKKQTTRLVKVECADCGYIARTTWKWLDEAGAPICPTDHEQMEVIV